MIETSNVAAQLYTGNLFSFFFLIKEFFLSLLFVSLQDFTESQYIRQKDRDMQSYSNYCSRFHSLEVAHACRASSEH